VLKRKGGRRGRGKKGPEFLAPKTVAVTQLRGHAEANTILKNKKKKRGKGAIIKKLAKNEEAPYQRLPAQKEGGALWTSGRMNPTYGDWER